jgi:hypothetical protein
VRALAPAIVAITNSVCHQDRDSFATISWFDIIGSGTRWQTCLSMARLYELWADGKGDQAYEEFDDRLDSRAVEYSLP